MDRTTRRRTLTLVAGIGLAGLAAGTGVASAQGEQTATAPAAAQDGHVHGTAAASGSAAGAAGAAGGAAAGEAIPAPPAPAGVCTQSDLPPHTGFQGGPACVSLPFGELGAQEDNPQLLITEAPDEVAVGEAFTLRVSTRNLVRDRFLAAADGGYYVESSTLTEDGLVRGHFHTACRVLGDADSAPRPDRQAIFVATEDGAGGAQPDTVTVRIPGLPAAGEAQCVSWAGDGSHRIPMMAFANQVPAVDAVRITVRGGGAAQRAEAPAQEAGTEAPATEAGAPATATGAPATATGAPATATDEATGTRRSGSGTRTSGSGTGQATGTGDKTGAVERAEVPRSTDGANAAGAASGDGKGKGTDPDD
jgi:hypothetical protein